MAKDSDYVEDTIPGRPVRPRHDTLIRGLPAELEEIDHHDDRNLHSWFAERARPFLETYSAERLPQIERDLQRLKASEDQNEEALPICFLGNSGVGKSTLINAVVAGHDAVLPQGSIGPLTAQATMVRFSDSPEFTVEYLPPKQLAKLRFVLEMAEARARNEPSNADVGEVSTDLPIVEVGNTRVLNLEDAETDVLEAYERQARLLIRGDQFAQVPRAYLVDALRQILGSKKRWKNELDGQDAQRVALIGQALDHARLGTKVRVELGADESRFKRSLADHASGFLAPLIKRLEVGWNSEVLKNGLLLVDLPGLGVANDEYRNVTEEWIRKSRAVVLVVDKSGVTEASAELLRTTGFLNRLLHDVYDPDASPVFLLVAVVKVDSVANDARQQEVAERGKAGARRWSEHFEEACAQAREMVRNQLRPELDRMARAGAEDTRSAREAVGQRVIDSLEVHPISAIEYRKLLLQDEDDRARITELAESKIPGFANGLEEIAYKRAVLMDEKKSRLAAQVRDRLGASLELIAAQWAHDANAAASAEQLSQELQNFARGLSDDFVRRQAAFREFLRETVPQVVEARVDESMNRIRGARREITAPFREFHWATLRAALRRGGHFQGAKHVDLANELGLRFEEPVALVWSEHVLQPLRKRTREFGEDSRRLLEELVKWIEAPGRGIDPALARAIHGDLAMDAPNLEEVGKEAIDLLRQRVRQELSLIIREKVREECERFVEAGHAVGAGVQANMRNFLENDLLPAIVKEVAPEVRRFLLEEYRAVERQMTTELQRYRNPVETAAAGLGRSVVEKHETDREHAQSVMAEVAGLQAELAQFTAETGSPS